MNLKSILTLFILIIIPFPLVAANPVIIDFDNVPVTSCDELWVESGVTLSFVNTTDEDCGAGSCSWGFWDNEVWLYPARLNLDLGGLSGTVTSAEIEIEDYCGENCTRTFLYNRDIKIDEDGNTVSYEPETLVLSNEGESVDRMAVSSCEGKVTKITLNLSDAFNCKKVSEISKTECKALVAFYESTDGYNWTDNTGWNDTNTPCDWYGVTCKNGSVSGLELTDNNLNGSISKKFFKLKKLKFLELSNNNLAGSSLNKFSKLKNLRTLWLNDCNLGGKIPSALMKLKKLESLDLNNNCLKTKVSNNLKEWLDDFDDNYGWDETQSCSD